MAGQEGDRRPDLSTLRRVLVMQRDLLGDVLLSTPALRALRHLLPHAEIVLLVRRGARELVDGNPHITRILYSDTLLEPGMNAGDVRAAIGLMRSLRAERFDCVLNLTKGAAFLHALLAWSTGALWRVAPKTVERVGLRGSDGFFPLHNVEVPLLPDRPITEYFLESVSLLGGGKADARLEMPIMTNDEGAVDRWLRKAGVGPHARLVAIHAGASRSAKALSDGLVIRLVDAIRRRPNVRVLLTGAPFETKRLERLRAMCQNGELPLVFAQPSLRRFGALLGRCYLLISGDSLPLHIAALHGIRTITVFGPDNPLHTAPRGWQHIALKAECTCRPSYSFVTHWPRPQVICQKRCIDWIPWESILQAIENQLDGSSSDACGKRSVTA